MNCGEDDVTHEPTTRDKILHQASLSFGQAGFDATRLADVATAVGIRRPSLLYWFATKDLLYDEVIATAFATLGDAVLNALASTGPTHARLDAAATALHYFFEASPHIAGLLVHELRQRDGTGPTLLLERAVPLLDQVEAQLGAVLPNGSPRPLPIRAAILAIISHQLLFHTTSAPLQQALWGQTSPEDTRTFVRALLAGPHGDPQ